MSPKKFLAPIMALVLILLGLYIVSLTRNSFENYNYIGKSPEFKEHITITGSGEVTVSPDIAIVSVGTIIEKSTVVAAQDENTRKMNSIIESLKNDFDIDSDDLKTKQYRISPRYQYKDRVRSIIGYTVSQSLTIKIRDFDKIGAIMSKVGVLGANTISGPNFSIDDPEAYKIAAREKAIDSAKEKARTLAKQVGINLGPIVGFAENIGGYPIPYVSYDTSMSLGLGGEAKATPQIEAGTEEVSVSVSITYEIR